MRTFSKMSRLMLAIVTAITMIVTNPVKAFAAGTWDDGVKNGRIVYAGYMQVVRVENGKTTAKRFGCDIYSVANGYSATYAQGICDKANAMLYDTPNTGKGFACTIGDHVKSTYSGKSASGYNINNYGTYQLWTCQIGDKLQVVYLMNDGYIVKNWYLESIDTNAYYNNSNEFVYFSNGKDIDEWGTADAQINNTIMLTHCWPNAWGSYPKAGCDGRVVAVFRENHTLAWDGYYKNDGTVIYGDYDIVKGTFAAK